MINLRDYFAQIHSKSLSGEEKLRIYQRFLDKSHRVIMRNKVAYYSRVTAFGIFTFVLAGGAFYLFSPTTNLYKVNELENGLVTLKSQNGVVHAEPIGRIITARGEIMITTADGKQIDGSELHSNDKVLLQAWAEILLTVSNGFQAKIIGPAVFVIEDGGMQGDVHIYTINLLEWDYMELARIEESQIVNKPSKIESVVVKTTDFHLEELHADAGGELDIIISTNTEGKKTITNHGDDILVKKIVHDSEKKIYAAVGEDQTVLVNGDIELIAEDVEKLVKDIEDNQLTIRYDLDADATALLMDDETIRDDAGEQDSDLADAKLVDADSVSALTALLDADASTKQVIDEDLMASITTALAVSFVSQDLEQVKKYFYAGDDTAFAIAYTNLTRRLQRVAQILWVEISPMTIRYDSVAQGSAAASQLLMHLEWNYYVSPGPANTLRTIISTLNTLQNQQFGQAKNEIDQPEVDAIEPITPETPVSSKLPDSASPVAIQATLDVSANLVMSVDNNQH